MNNILRYVLSFLFISLWFICNGQEKKMYWSDGNIPAILRSNVDGSELEVIADQSLLNPYDVTVDEKTEKFTGRTEVVE